MTKPRRGCSEDAKSKKGKIHKKTQERDEK